jgi:hypothetical protein
MKAPPSGIVNEFASTFAKKGKGKGFTQDEIFNFFRRYSNSVAYSDGPLPSKHDLFHNYLRQLAPEDQYRALIDLCNGPLETQNPLPTEEERKQLFHDLHFSGNNDGLCVCASTLDGWEIRKEWLKAISRLEKSPDASITSARTTLETTCKRILLDSGQSISDLKEGDLGKLVKMTEKCLGIKYGSEIIASGVGSIITGVAQQSNLAGDRHGTPIKYDISLGEARLVCNVCFSLVLFLLDFYKLRDAPPVVIQATTAN